MIGLAHRKSVYRKVLLGSREISAGKRGVWTIPEILASHKILRLAGHAYQAAAATTPDDDERSYCEYLVLPCVSHFSLT
jgi:hypothetical protein